MPKGKNAAALFEVINKSKGMRTQRTSGALRTPRWWFRRSSESATSAPPVTSAPRIEDIPQEEKKVAVDPDRQEVAFRLSYTTLGIIAGALVIVVVLTVYIARGRPGTAGSDTMAAASPSVLNVRKQGDSANPLLAGADGVGNSATSNPDDTPTSARQPNQPLPPPQLAADPEPPSTNATPIAPPTKADRIVNLNYIIVQSYPDAKDAQEVVALLAAKGVPTTIERNLAGYPKWHIVVTTEGFPKISSPEFNALRKRIDQVSADQARKDKKWKPLTPMGYRWR